MSTLHDIIALYTYDNWKHTALDLHKLDKKTLRKDIVYGFQDFYFTIWNTMCETCRDTYVFEWFNKCVEAINNKTDIPVYDHKCMNYYGFYQRFTKTICLMLKNKHPFLFHPLMHPILLKIIAKC